MVWFECVSVCVWFECVCDWDGGGGGGGGVMKIKIILCVEEDYMCEWKLDVFRVYWNFVFELWLMGWVMEYKCVLNVMKLDKVFAKSFAG